MMTQDSPHSVSRGATGANFAAKEARKSELILWARRLREEGRAEEAATRFAESAELEDELGDHCEELGLNDKALVHRFSSASCWAQAGVFYHAIAQCEAMLAELHPQHRLYPRVRAFADTLRTRRSEWYSSLQLADSVASG